MKTIKIIIPVLMMLIVFACSQSDDRSLEERKQAIRMILAGCKEMNNCKERLQRLMEERGKNDPQFAKALKEVAKDMNINLED